MHVLWPGRALGSGLSMSIAEVCHYYQSMRCTTGNHFHWTWVSKKRVSSPPISPGADCLRHAGEPIPYSGATTLTSSNSLCATLCSLLVLENFERLVDSGSSNCFLDMSFITKNRLPFWEIDPLSIALIDSTVNAHVTRIITLPINFTYGYSCIPDFYVTKLEGIYPAVLGYSWLTYCNPTINWVKDTILFQTSSLVPKAIVNKPPKMWLLSPRNQTSPTSESSLSSPMLGPPAYPTNSHNDQKPIISFVNTLAFQHACRTRESRIF